MAQICRIEVLAAILALSLGCTNLQREASWWEYKSLTYEVRGDFNRNGEKVYFNDDFTALLNQQAQDGWALHRMTDVIIPRFREDSLEILLVFRKPRE